MTKFDISIVSDTVCPWCYVGKNRLSLAIKQHQNKHPSDTFSTTWLPFYLNPDAPRSIDKQEYYNSKFGPQRTAMMQSHLATLGKQVGINFAFGGRTGNTRDSHRLIQLGKAKGGEALQTKVVEELFEAYFEKEEDITDKEVLIRRGVRAGIDEGECRQWLDGEGGGKEVDKEVEMAQRKFVTGVPNFTVNGRYEVQGAEDPGAFLQIFEEIKQDGDDSKGATFDGQNAC